MEKIVNLLILFEGQVDSRDSSFLIFVPAHVWTYIENQLSLLSLVSL